VPLVGGREDLLWKKTRRDTPNSRAIGEGLALRGSLIKAAAEQVIKAWFTILRKLGRVELWMIFHFWEAPKRGWVKRRLSLSVIREQPVRVDSKKKENGSGSSRGEETGQERVEKKDKRGKNGSIKQWKGKESTRNFN